MYKHLEVKVLVARKKFKETPKLNELGNHILKHQ